jgi:hypothetical protein
MKVNTPKVADSTAGKGGIVLPPSRGPQLRVFLSYSHRDERLRQELRKHLSPLRRSGLIRDWHDRELTPGCDFESEIDSYLQNADLVLLLVTPDFIASDYCYEKELLRAVKRHQIGETHVVPLILRPVDWTGTPLGKLQALPRDGRPVTSWPKRDEGFLDIARGIRKIADAILAGRSLASR